jgi:hypothetical protein
MSNKWILLVFSSLQTAGLYFSLFTIFNNAYDPSKIIPSLIFGFLTIITDNYIFKKKKNGIDNDGL